MAQQSIEYNENLSDHGDLTDDDILSDHGDLSDEDINEKDNAIYVLSDDDILSDHGYLSDEDINEKDNATYVLSDDDWPDHDLTDHELSDTDEDEMYKTSHSLIVNAMVNPHLFYCVIPRLKPKPINIFDAKLLQQDGWETLEEYVAHQYLPSTVTIYLPIGEISLGEILPGSVSVKYLRFVSLDADVTMLSLEGIESFTFLKYIGLSRENVKITCFHGIEFCQFLKHIYFSNSGLSDLSSLAGMHLNVAHLENNPIQNLSGLSCRELYVDVKCLLDLDNNTMMHNYQVHTLFASCPSEWKLSGDAGEDFDYLLASRNDLKAILKSAARIQDRLREKNVRSSVIFINEYHIGSGHARFHSLDELLYRARKCRSYIRKYGIPRLRNLYEFE
jgi:hypothetical protein